MTDYTAATYGDRIAEVYDELYGFPEETDAAVELLADLAAGGAVLELGIGTGRLALPLSRRGLPVAGIDASEAMTARLRAKPGGDAIAPTVATSRTSPPRDPSGSSSWPSTRSSRC